MYFCYVEPNIGGEQGNTEISNNLINSGGSHIMKNTKINYYEAHEEENG